MTDNLSWLCFAREKALSEVMSSQKEKVFPFLLGECSSAEDVLPLGASGLMEESDSLGKYSALGIPSLFHCLPALCNPSSGSSRHGMIPLAIVEESVFSVSASSAIHLVRQQFLSDGVKNEDEEEERFMYLPKNGAKSERREIRNRFDEVFTLRVSGEQDKKNFLCDVARQSCLAAVEAYLELIIQEAKKKVAYASGDDAKQQRVSPESTENKKKRRIFECSPSSSEQENWSSTGSSFPISSSRIYRDERSNGVMNVDDVLAFTDKKRKRKRDEMEHHKGRQHLCYSSKTSSPLINVHRLLIVVSCSAGSSQIFSLPSGLPSSSFREGQNPQHYGGATDEKCASNAFSFHRSFPSYPRHRSHQGLDSLCLFLSDLVALYQKTRVKLSTLQRFGSCCDSNKVGISGDYSSTFAPAQLVHRVHMAVLLIPQDDLYGITQLAQRLSPLFGSEYLIRCFDQSDLEVTVDAPLVGQNYCHKRRGSNKKIKPQKIKITYDSRLTHRMLVFWEPVRAAFSPSVLSGMGSGGKDTEPPLGGTGAITNDIDSLLLSESRFFFLRPNNLVLAWFLWHSFQLFPVLLFPSWFEFVQRLWAFRHSLDDIVCAFSSLLMPFYFSTESFSPRFISGNDQCEEAEVEKEKVALLLDALYAAASELSVKFLLSTELSAAPHSSLANFWELKKAKGVSSESHASLDKDDFTSDFSFFGSHVEVVFFMLLYEDLIYGRRSRLFHFPSIVRCLAAFSSAISKIDSCTVDQENVNISNIDHGRCLPTDDYALALKVLESGALPFLHRFTISLTSSSGFGEAQSSLLPQLTAAQHGSLAPSVLQKLQCAAIFCALPPFSSLEELNATLNHSYRPSCRGRLSSVDAPSLHHNLDFQRDPFLSPSSSMISTPFLPSLGSKALSVSPNNFFSPLVTDEARLLHLLTTHALKVLHPNATSSLSFSNERAKEGSLFVPLTELQWATSLTETSLISTLEVLRSSGLVIVSPRDVAARSTLVANPFLC